MDKKLAAKVPKRKKLLATGGGNATASGVSFQASLAAYFSSQGLAEMPLDARLGLGSTRATHLRFETEAPVDDILLSMSNGGWLFIQGKNSLTNSSSLNSELGKTCDEFVRLWEATSAGSGKRGWDRPLRPGVDILLIAVGPTTSGTIKNHLARALEIARNGSTATLSREQSRALQSFRKLLGSSLTSRGGAAASANLDAILTFVHVLDFDFSGPHRITAETLLSAALISPSSAPAALSVLEKECERRMATRSGVSLAGLRTELARSGVAINAPHDYRLDIQALKDRTTHFAQALQDYENLNVSGKSISISRECALSCFAAAKAGSLLVIGDPGVGKSAIINETARRHIADGNDVVLLAVDRLQVESIDGLSIALGISHPIADVLANWPGSGPGFLILDALDACRFGRSEGLFRTMMQDVMKLAEKRWQVLASIRTFDLMVGQEFGRLFYGTPPSPLHTDARFQTARHIKVPEWSDEEFEELLAKAPVLGTSIRSGGPKLAELARVPFNTRLLSDLLFTGVAPEKLGSVGSQVELLEMYWSERVRPIGMPAEQCLGSTILSMIDRGQMEAPRIVAGSGTGGALDQLLQCGVLISVNGDHDVAFRHHILFDYVASRTAIDLDDARKTDELLKRSEASLLLAPALSFALQHLWQTSGARRERFWQILTNLAGPTNSDPIIRTTAARVGCELPSQAEDMVGLSKLLALPSVDDNAFEMFRQVIGSLSVRLEDEPIVSTAPWCSIAESAAPFVKKLAWSLRTLVHSLIARALDATQLSQLGVAARAVMEHALVAPGGELLMPLAIGFVSKTFGTDSTASRCLIERILEPKRMKEHAPNDMHWLAREVGEIANYDAGLVVQIYDRVFAHVIEENAPTNMGNSKILALKSNRRQDFKMSQWALKEAFPAFAERHHLEATDAAIKVARNFIKNEHTPKEPVETLTLTVGNQVGRVTPDYSYIWAPKHRAQYSGDAVQIVDGLVEILEKASDSDASQIADTLIAKNVFGWLWNRLLTVAAKRGGALAEKCWPWAAETELLRLSDTMKPALDLLASEYGRRTSTERQEVEMKVLDLKFPMSSNPVDAAQYFRRKVFGAIGKEALETQAAKEIVIEAIATSQDIENDDNYPFFEPKGFESEEFHWLRTKGVDIASKSNSSILAAVTACDDLISNQKSNTEATLAAVQRLHALLIANSVQAHTLVKAQGWEKIAWAIERTTMEFKSVSAFTDPQRTEIENLCKTLSATLASSSEEDDSILNEARAKTAGSIMNMVRSAPATAAHFSEEIRAFAFDRSADVRGEIARRIGYLWNSDKMLLWQLVEKFAEEEVDAHVLLHLVNFLSSASNDQPNLVGALTQTILRRNNIEKSEGRDFFHEGMGALVLYLWIRHGQTEARQTIDQWLSARSSFKTELRHGAFWLMESLVIGYDNDNVLDRETRLRCQNLAFEIIDCSARGLESYLALDRVDQTSSRNEEASEDAALMSQMSDQFLFAVGAQELLKGEVPGVLKEMSIRKSFLSDNEKSFRRVGDVGTPDAVYHMLQLMDFLASSDPDKVFDLTSHALLQAGKIHGYQSESLGVDQFVKMIGRMIADHREIFDDHARRLALVEVLQVFVDVGWPAARRLLYRLPEALR